MVNILKLLSEQITKIHATFNGGFKYGSDYNILKDIIEYCDDKPLVTRLVDSLTDEDLKVKVKMWMGV